jgi:hypothetical protein
MSYSLPHLKVPLAVLLQRFLHTSLGRFKPEGFDHGRHCSCNGARLANCYRMLSIVVPLAHVWLAASLPAGSSKVRSA